MTGSACIRGTCCLAEHDYLGVVPKPQNGTAEMCVTGQRRGGVVEGGGRGVGVGGGGGCKETKQTKTFKMIKI